MAVLPKPKHERFAQELAKGKTELEAYEIAGFKADAGNANKLGRRTEIQARVQEITSRGAERAEVTVASLISEAEEARLLAMTANQASAAVAAIREKGVLSGKRIERAEHGAPGDFDKMSDNELADFIQTRAARTGTSVPGVGATPGSNGAGKLTH